MGSYGFILPSSQVRPFVTRGSVGTLHAQISSIESNRQAREEAAAAKRDEVAARKATFKEAKEGKKFSQNIDLLKKRNENPDANAPSAGRQGFDFVFGGGILILLLSRDKLIATKSKRRKAQAPPAPVAAKPTRPTRKNTAAARAKVKSKAVLPKKKITATNAKGTDKKVIAKKPPVAKKKPAIKKANAKETATDDSKDLQKS